MALVNVGVQDSPILNEQCTGNGAITDTDGGPLSDALDEVPGISGDEGPV